MIGLVCGILIVLSSASVNGVKFYPTDVGFGGGEGYGHKYTNVEYGPAVYGYNHGLGHHGYKEGISGGYASGVGHGLAYADGIVGVPKAPGLDYGSKVIGPGYGYGADIGGYKGDIGYAHHAGIGYGHGFGAVHKPIGLGYETEVAHYPAITKSVGYKYGPVPAISYAKPLGHGIEYAHVGSPAIGIGGFGHLGHGKYIGGTEIDQNVYSGGNKNIADEHFVKSHGVKGEELNHGDAGFSRGNVAVKDIKGDSLYFVDADGVNQAHHAGKAFSGGEHFDKEGKHGGEQVNKEGFKKGHNIKSFKKSHHLDESGKTEEYYDENHDEGGNYAFDGHAGRFGESGASSYKGGHEDGKFNSGEVKKEGHYDNEYIVDKAHADHGKFGGNKYAKNEEVYGTHKGIGEHDLSGHHESNNFYKKYPIYY